LNTKFVNTTYKISSLLMGKL